MEHWSFSRDIFNLIKKNNIKKTVSLPMLSKKFVLSIKVKILIIRSNFLLSKLHELIIKFQHSQQIKYNHEILTRHFPKKKKNQDTNENLNILHSPFQPYKLFTHNPFTLFSLDPALPTGKAGWRNSRSFPGLLAPNSAP